MRIGAQRPRFLTVPDCHSSAGGEAVDLAAQCGLVLDPWQQLVVESAFGERADGSWAAMEVAVVVPRQNGKGSVLEAIELAGLFLFGEELILHSAHEFKTAQEAFRRVLGLVQSSGDLESRVLRVRTSHGEEGIELRNGSRLRFIARSGGSGRGFSGDRIILDEAYNLPGETIAALGPTVSARPNPQIVYASSAPLEGDESEVLRALMRRGRVGSERLAYLEWCAGDGADVGDVDGWYEANPGLGVRLSEERIRSFELSAFPKDVFARERLGVVDLSDQAANGVLDLAAWAGCVDGGSVAEGVPAFALDMTSDRRSASIVAASRSSLGGVHVEVVDHREGSRWLVGRAVELVERWGGRFAIAVGSPAWSLQPELRDAGVPLFEVSTAVHAQACGSFADAVNSGDLRVCHSLALERAVQAAHVKYFGDSWLWARRRTDVDISPLVGATLARWAFLNPEVVESPDVKLVVL